MTMPAPRSDDSRPGVTVIGNHVAAVPPLPPAQAVETVSVLVSRLDAVDRQLADADVAVHELLRLLEPVLPVDFARTPRPQPDARAVETSLLAARLAYIAERTESLVLRVRSITAAVDL